MRGGRIESTPNVPRNVPRNVPAIFLHQETLTMRLATPVTYGRMNKSEHDKARLNGSLVVKECCTLEN